MKAVAILTVICLFSVAFCDDASVTCSPDDVLVLPVAGDCTKYIVCRGGDLQEYQCPAGLEFNSKEKVCDWPDNAGCSQ